MFKVAAGNKKSFILYSLDRLTQHLWWEVLWDAAVNHKLQNKFENQYKKRSQRDQGEAAVQMALTTLLQVNASSYNSSRPGSDLKL